MRRTALIHLEQWLVASKRKPLVIRGARQVGKTWLVRYFANMHNKQLIELNFEKNAQLKTLFTSNDPREILLKLETAYNISIDPEHSLLFLDEIQVVPELLSKLRWFAEELPELPVITAGSLLEFVLNDHSFSMPVGRISYLYLEPLSFEEFIQASGDKLYEFLTTFQWGEEIPAFIHEKLLSLFKEYMIIGGMPAAVADWVSNRSLSQVNQIHHDLLATYRDDFSKYAGKLPTERLDEAIVAVVRMMGKKFVYKQVNEMVQAKAIKNALNLLTAARICHPVNCSSANGVPLAEIGRAHV